MPESQGGSVPAKLPDLMLIRGLGDGIRGLDTVRVWCINLSPRIVALPTGKPGGAHGPPLIFLQVMTSIPDSHRDQYPTSSRMNGLILRIAGCAAESWSAIGPGDQFREGGSCDRWSLTMRIGTVYVDQ